MVTDFEQPPDPRNEVRLCKNGDFISLWTPARASSIARAMQLLAKAGWELMHTDPEMYRADLERTKGARC